MAVYIRWRAGRAVASLLICLGIGAAVGTVNAVLIVTLRLQTIAATLGTMFAAQGLALVILDAPGGMVADWVSYELTDSLFGIVPIAGLVMLAVALVWLVFQAHRSRHWSIMPSGATSRRPSFPGSRWKGCAMPPSSVRECFMASPASC